VGDLCWRWKLVRTKNVLWQAMGVAGLAIAMSMSGGWVVARAQSEVQKSERDQSQARVAVANPDVQIVTGAAMKPRTRAQLTGDAWELLTNATSDDRRPETKIQGLAALGTMGSNARSTKMIVNSFGDKDVDVRTAAVLAAGQTRDRRLEPQLRRMLDDKEPEVAFAAASTLWKMGDHSGEDLLLAVVDGERRTNATLMHGSIHRANREMHNPAALAKLGALEGASMLLGPFGFGITAYEYIKKNGGGDSARVSAVDHLARSRSLEIRKTLQAALGDKNPGVRAAAAHAMRSYHDEEAAKALAALFNDPKRPVQFSAAAAYLICVRAVATPPLAPLTP
jgi:hypothetical protein